MTEHIKYEFSSLVWKQPSTNSWHFVSLPAELSAEIRKLFKWQEEGWGRLKATAKIGDNEWETAIWFDSKRMTYLLPLKSLIRKKEKIKLGDDIKVIIWV